jgi:CDP-2,3-bis-(O-geranylgeranyl)-sn-glycerol synthase
MSMILTILQSIYFLVPAYFANMAPIIVKKIKFLNFFAAPIDLGNRFIDGKPYFGRNKTYRGFLAAIIMGIIGAFIQFFLFNLEFFRWVSIPGINFSSVWTPLFLGTLLGTGAITGDLIKSFFKRRLNILPGSPFIPLDQIDFVIGAYLFVSIFYLKYLSWPLVLSSFILSFFLHIIVNHVAYYLGIRKEKW